MKKVLLVFDDYAELSTTEVYLKRVGFDVVGISNELKLSDQLLAFNPDIVLVNGRSSRVSSISVGAKLKDNLRFHGRVIIALPKGIRPSPQELGRIKMDLTLEAPLNPIQVIQSLAKLGGMDVIGLVEKFKKATLSDPVLKEKFRQLSIGEAREFGPDRKRIERYQDLIGHEKIDTQYSTFSKNEVKERQDAMQKDWNKEELEELDRLKRDFVDALFKKD